jgi:ABC-type sugar transport system substrate-binding protein
MNKLWHLLLALPTLAGCADMFGMELSTSTKDYGSDSGGAGGSSAPPPHEGVTIVWMSNGTSSSFFDTSRNGAVLAAQQLTNSTGKPVSVSITDPANNMAATQAQRIREAVAANVDGLAVDVIDPTVISPEIDEAVQKGVTVMTFDSDAPGSKRISYYSMDNQASGALAAKILTSLMGDSGGKIAIMNKESPPTAANFAARRDGFTRELAKHPGFSVVVDLPCTDGPNGEVMLQAGCTGVLENAMAAHPEVTGWFLARGRILREENLATEAPTFTAAIKAGKAFAVSYDAIPESLANINAGYVNATISQKYFGWGYDVVNLLHDIITTKRSVNPFTDSSFDVACENNIDQISQAWTLQNFSKTIPKCSLAGSDWP